MKLHINCILNCTIRIRRSYRNLTVFTIYPSYVVHLQRKVFKLLLLFFLNYAHFSLPSCIYISSFVNSTSTETDSHILHGIVHPSYRFKFEAFAWNRLEKKKKKKKKKRKKERKLAQKEIKSNAEKSRKKKNKKRKLRSIYARTCNVVLRVHSTRVTRVSFSSIIRMTRVRMYVSSQEMNKVEGVNDA